MEIRNLLGGIQMKKLVKVGSVIAITGLLLTGCVPNSCNDGEFEEINQFSNGLTEIRNKKTGVHYYIGDDIMCPVYNFNGQIKTTEKTK